MSKVKILWADDEIDLLKGHVLFLNDKGYQVSTANSGEDALELMQKEPYDIVFLDENMPGLSGLETLSRIKTINNEVPVIMITKSEEEHIMEDAIGSKIADYLIKPVNPNQILLSVKKNLENKRLISEKTTSAYQQEFRQIMMEMSDRLSHEQWIELYKKLVYWELELEQSKDSGMNEILSSQKREANQLFSRFIESNYINWLKKPEEAPIMSHYLMRRKALPFIEASDRPVFFVLIDNLRYDQWKIIQPLLGEYFRVQTEECFYSILPTATQYARNALFSGLMPADIEKMYPKLWKNEDEEGSKNEFEEELLNLQLQRLRKEMKVSYTKITNHNAGLELVDNILNLTNNKLNVIVYNFVDMLSHARTEMEVIRELADDEKAYRSLTLSWFENSPLFEALKKLADKSVKLVITTDHGTIKVDEPVQVVGDRNTNTNLRYKQGRNLNYNKKEVFEIRNPADAMLPKSNLSSSYVFARESGFFVYPNNYNHYMKYYKDTFQHGGLSLEEMIIPYIELESK